MSGSGGTRQLFALAATVLMIMASVPAGTIPASAAAGNAGNTALIDSGDRSDQAIDGPPVVLKWQAITTIENLTAESNRLAAARDRARSRLNDSFVYYQGPTRVTDQHLFVEDAVGLRALAAFDGTGQDERLQRIVTLVARADNRSARQVIRAAENAFAATEDRLGPGITNSAEAHIDNARRQLDRTERIRERAQNQEGARYIRTMARAVRQYGVALNQARTALRLIDRETSPDVTLTRRVDPIRNGSKRTPYTLTGRVTDPTGLDTVNVTATINDDRTVPLSLRGGYTNASFGTTINLSERVNTIEVRTIRSTDSQQSKRGNGKQKGKKKGKRKGRRRGNGNGGGEPPGRSQESRASTVVLRLDGDGLPDTYERNVTGTDPLDPDSDSTLTDDDEADNGTIDAYEDFDADGLDNVDVNVIPQPYNEVVVYNMRENGWNTGPGNLFRKKKFRQGLGCAIDKQTLVQGVFRDYANVEYTWQPRWSRWYPSDADMMEFGTGELYGQEAAQSRIEEAIADTDYSYDSNGNLLNPSGDQCTITLYHSAGQNTERSMAEFIAQEFEDNAGIVVEVNAIQGAQFANEYWAQEIPENADELEWSNGQYNAGPRDEATSANGWDMTVVFGLNTYPLNPLAGEVFFQKDSFYNPYGYYPSWDAKDLFEQANAAESTDELEDIFSEIFVNIAEDQPMGMLAFPSGRSGYASDIVGPAENFFSGWNFPGWYREE